MATSLDQIGQGYASRVSDFLRAPGDFRTRLQNYGQYGSFANPQPDTNPAIVNTGGTGGVLGAAASNAANNAANSFAGQQTGGNAMLGASNSIYDQPAGGGPATDNTGATNANAYGGGLGSQAGNATQQSQANPWNGAMFGNNPNQRFPMWSGASGFGGLGMSYSGQYPGVGARYWARLNNIGGT